MIQIICDTLRLKVGSCVMLTTNVDVSDGLTNGSMGVVQHIDGVATSLKAILHVMHLEHSFQLH